MAFLTLFMRRQLPQAVSHYARLVKLPGPPSAGAPLRRLHGSARRRVVEKGPWGKNRGPEPQQQQYPLTDLDKADALMLRKSHETDMQNYEVPAFISSHPSPTTAAQAQQLTYSSAQTL